MKIAIITQAPFPEGLATTNRVYYHAKGLKENGVDVKIFLTMPTERKGKIVNNEVNGIKNGIPFEYTPGKTIRSSYFIQRRIDDFLGPIKAAIKVIKGNYDAGVLISCNSAYQIMLFKIMFFLGKVKYIAERTELPFHGRRQDGIFKYRNKFLELFLYKDLYGFLTISKVLQKHYKMIVSKDCPVVLIPVIVDVNEIYKEEVTRTRNLVYTGPLLQKKDGILTIIESFAIISKEFPDTRIILTGSMDLSDDKDRIEALISKFNLKDKMDFKGFVTREEMVNYLNSAVGLVLAKPSSDQADTCFPTKLGEYLATGNPIVVTRTGEIPLYLKDGENAYIAEPDSVESFTSKLRELLNNPEKANEIGQNGKAIAGKSFNYAEIAKKVIKLVNDRKYYLKNEK
ncbi:MAG: glycosyltransferase [Candidatus Delongbacteria bacterium]|nr:glycosyltransferase [Candidatus Delongbacteria bacterium]